MSQTLVIELSDEVYAAIQRRATQAHLSPAQVVATSLEHAFGEAHRDQPVASIMLSEAEIQAARERFERHFGAVDLGYPTGIDNEHIDADLAREYSTTGEEA